MRPRQQNIFFTLVAKVWVFRARVIAAIVLLIVAKVAAVMVPLILKRIVDLFSEPDAIAVLPVALLAGYAAVRFSTTLFGELRDLVFVRAAKSAVADYTAAVFSHLHALGHRFHSNRATGALTRDVERGTAAIGFLLGAGLFTIVPTIVEIAIVVGIMITSYAGGFAAIIAATFVLYGAFTVHFTRRRMIRQRRVNQLDSNAHRRLVDSLLNYDSVKLYTNEAFEARRFRTIMKDWVDAGVVNQISLTQLHIGQSGIIGIGIASVMLLAGQQALEGQMTVGDLVLVNAYIIQVCLPLNSLGFVFREASDALVNAERLLGLLREPPEVEADDELVRLRVANAEVRFSQVSFGYERSRQILYDVDFRIGPGETVAVTGGSGSGKSTIARLLLKFYEPWSGEISIDGQNLAGLAPDSVRAAIGVVPQDTSLFDESIEYNIAYGRAGATREEVIEAARAAEVHEFIASLPDGYDTVVGERGVRLSGGEKQRLAIARAMLKNPPILVLDEATSALDVRSERAIQRTLDQIARRRTTLVVAHRLSTVVDADEILVLEHGHVSERGRHEQLLAQGGIYAQMWSLQEHERQLRHASSRARWRPVDVAGLVAGAIDAIRGEIESRGIGLYTALGFGARLVTADAEALEAVISALLAHSTLATPAGGRIDVSLGRAGNEIRFQLTDTSATAEDDAAARPLDRRSLAATIAEHGGRFSIERVAQGGCRYVVTLPVRAVADQPGLGRDSAGKADDELLRGLRLLLVDDDEDNREIVATLLELHGAAADGFATGREALGFLAGLAQEDWPDVMICDIGLPVEDGYLVLRRIRALEDERNVPLRKRMPAIALTGYATPDNRSEAVLAGFQAYLVKPVSYETLLATIGRLLGERD